MRKRITRIQEEQPLDNIKQAIKNALVKTDAQNAASRQRVYESAWSAHERALAANAALSSAQRDQRRQNLKDAIVEIEKEFVSDNQLRDQAAPSVNISENVDPVLGTSVAEEALVLDGNDVRASSLGDTQVERKRNNQKVGMSRLRKTDKGKSHSPLYRYGIPVLVVVLALMIGTSLYNSFADLSREPSPSATNVQENTAPLKEGEEPGDETWITVFQASEAARMAVKGRATAEILRDGQRSFARITSSGGDNTVSFDIGEGILDRFSGNKVTFDIIAKADGGKSTQMSISCNFASLGDCGRRRYDVNQTMNDFLFDLTFPAGQKAGGAGIITVNSDLSGTGKPVDIYEIRVSLHEAK